MFHEDREAISGNYHLHSNYDTLGSSVSKVGGGLINQSGPAMCLQKAREILGCVVH